VCKYISANVNIHRCENFYYHKYENFQYSAGKLVEIIHFKFYLFEDQWQPPTGRICGNIKITPCYSVLFAELVELPIYYCLP